MRPPRVKNKDRIKRMGWTVYLVECIDGTYHGGMTRDLEKEMVEMNVFKSGYFCRHLDKIPVKIVFKDPNLPFREAFAKKCYLIDMNRRQRKKLIETQKWNNSWRLYHRGIRSISGIIGQRQR
jgi:predicted GIY-YIG superfamily endonuclease